MRNVKAMILVGGLGTRLRSVVPFQPKALASIGERPFLGLLVRQLCSQGICNLVMCTGYLAEQIQSTFGNGKTWGATIEYSMEETPMGTAGAVKLAQHYIDNTSDFLVLNGDSFLEINFHDLLAFHRSHDHAVATMAVVHVDDASRYGTVRVDATDRVIEFTEKTERRTAGLVNAGVYVFSQSIWGHIPEGPASLETDVFPKLLGQGIYTQQQHGLFIDIGTPADYARAQQLLRSS